MRRGARQAEQAISSPTDAMEEEKDPLMAAEGLPLALPPAGTVGAVPAAAESTVERRRRRLDRDGSRRHRRRVAALYAELRAMIPAIPTARRRPATKEEVVTAAAARVKELEGAAAALEARREAAAAAAAVTSLGAMTFSARLPAPAPAGALRRVVEAVERRGARVLLATLARLGGGGGEGGGGAVIVTITVAVAAPEVVEMIRADIAGIN